MYRVLIKNSLVQPIPLQVHNMFEFHYPSTKPVTIPRLESQFFSTIISLARGIIVRCIPLLKVLALWRKEKGSYKIWTRVALLISYDDNHYTTSTTVDEFIQHIYPAGYPELIIWDIFLDPWRMSNHSFVSYHNAKRHRK